jgi:hypothetical protein
VKTPKHWINVCGIKTVANGKKTRMAEAVGVMSRYIFALLRVEGDVYAVAFGDVVATAVEGGITSGTGLFHRHPCY